MSAALTFALALLAAPPAEGPLPQMWFDIVCDGDEIDEMPGGRPMSAQERISIDLFAGTWRPAGRVEATPIHRVTDNLIILHDDGARVLRSFLSYDRGTKTLTRVAANGRLRQTRTCRTEPFTEPEG